MKGGTTTGRRAQAEMPFLDHLEELRGRLIWSVLALLVGLVLGLQCAGDRGAPNP